MLTVAAVLSIRVQPPAIVGQVVPGIPDLHHVMGQVMPFTSLIGLRCWWMALRAIVFQAHAVEHRRWYRLNIVLDGIGTVGARFLLTAIE
jgi:hypothetical protein